MSKKETVATEEFDPSTVAPDTVLAVINKKEDGYYLTDTQTGTETGPLKTCDEGATLVLPKNSSNRKWVRIKVADAAIAEHGQCDLVYKASKTFGSVTTVRRIPNAKLFEYLSEEEQAEVKAIFDRAYDAMAADKAAIKPVTDVDKIKAKIAKLQAQLEEVEKLAE